MERLMAQMKACHKITTELKVSQENMDAWIEEMKTTACQEAMPACLENAKANQDRTNAGLEEMEAVVDAFRKKGRIKLITRIWKTIESVAEHQEVSKDETGVENYESTGNRYGDRCQDVRRRRQPKNRTNSDGGSRQKLAAARGLLTNLAIPALGTGRGNKGQTVEKRRLMES
jgi:hypothetical protein